MLIPRGGKISSNKGLIIITYATTKNIRYTYQVHKQQKNISIFVSEWQ